MVRLCSAMRTLSSKFSSQSALALSHLTGRSTRGAVAALESTGLSGPKRGGNTDKFEDLEELQCNSG
jgi:hypothetical protein